MIIDLPVMLLCWLMLFLFQIVGFALTYKLYAHKSIDAVWGFGRLATWIFISLTVWFLGHLKLPVNQSVFIYLIFSPVIVSQLIDTPQTSITERFLEAFSRRRWEGEYYGLGRLFFIVKTPTVVVASSPFFGVGPGQYGGGTARALNNTTVYDKLSLPFGIWGTEGYIDNNWMSLWGEIGTLGLICYLWLIYTLFKMSYGVYKKAKDNFDRGLALGYCGVIVAVCLNAFLATMLEIRTLALYFWLFGGIIYIFYTESHKKIV